MYTLPDIDFVLSVQNIFASLETSKNAEIHPRQEIYCLVNTFDFFLSETQHLKMSKLLVTLSLVLGIVLSSSNNKGKPAGSSSVGTHKRVVSKPKGCCGLFCRKGVVNAVRDDDSPPPTYVVPDIIVKRKEIRTFNEFEQQRFVLDIKKMMQNKFGPQTSPYYEIAKWYGEQQFNCYYGGESFPNWNRLFLREFEKQLQLADVQNGFDGNIGILLLFCVYISIYT